MFLNNVFHFMKGYVIINVSGLGIERFLYICAKRKIALFNMGTPSDNGIALCMSISDFRRIKPAVRKSGAYIRIVKKCGLPFLAKQFRRRYILLFGFVIMACAMFISSFFIWSVEIQKRQSRSDAREAFRSVQHYGAPRRSYHEHYRKKRKCRRKKRRYGFKG